jgi:hypothetical protein
MGDPARGHLSYLQFGREAVAGTAVPATHRLPFIGNVVTPDIGFIVSDLLDNNVDRVGFYQGGQAFPFTIEGELWYEGLLLILDGLFGTATFAANGGTTTGANPYVHTFIERALLNSYTFQFIDGNVPASQCQRITGAKLVGITIKCVAGRTNDAIGKFTIEGFATGYSAGQTPTGALSAVAALPVLFHEASTVDDGTADAASLIAMKDFELSMTSPVDRDRHYMGSVSPLEALRNDFVDVTFKFKKEFQSTTLLAAGLAFTSGSPKLVFGSSASKRLTFDIGSAKIKTYTHPVNGYGIIMQNCEWKAFKDPTNLSALKVVVENTQATITTP